MSNANDDFGALEAVLQAQEEAQAAFGGDDTFTKEVYGLIDTEVIIVRFIGGAGEPYKMHYHTLAPLGGAVFGERFLCLGAGCPGCVSASVKGEKRITPASLWAAFSVYSTRPMFLIPTAKQDGSGSYNKREPLRRNMEGYALQKNGAGTVMYPNGQHPLTGHQWEEEGIRVWKGSMSPKVQNAARIAAMANDLKTRCHCGKVAGSGMNTVPARVQAHSYTCANCGKPVAAPTQGQSIMCGSCHHAGHPEEQLVCTAGCGNPAKGSLRSCYVQIKRVGANNKTIYEFTAMPFSNPEAHHMGQLYRQENSVWVPNSLPLAEIYKPNESALRTAMIARGLVTQTAQVSVPGGMPGTMPGMMPGVVPGAVANNNPFGATPFPGPNPMGATAGPPAAMTAPAGAQPMPGPAAVGNPFAQPQQPAAMAPPMTFQPAAAPAAPTAMAPPQAAPMPGQQNNPLPGPSTTLKPLFKGL